jgi:hypothetical protein
VDALILLMETENAPGESLHLAQPLTPDALAAVGSYLADRQPELQLAEIRESLRLLRKALERTFTLGDILVSLSTGPGRADDLGLFRDLGFGMERDGTGRY